MIFIIHRLFVLTCRGQYWLHIEVQAFGLSVLLSVGVAIYEEAFGGRELNKSQIIPTEPLKALS